MASFARCKGSAETPFPISQFAHGVGLQVVTYVKIGAAHRRQSRLFTLLAQVFAKIEQLLELILSQTIPFEMVGVLLAL